MYIVYVDGKVLETYTQKQSIVGDIYELAAEVPCVGSRAASSGCPAASVRDRELDCCFAWPFLDWGVGWETLRVPARYGLLVIGFLCEPREEVLYLRVTSDFFSFIGSGSRIMSLLHRNDVFESSQLSRRQNQVPIYCMLILELSATLLSSCFCVRLVLFLLVWAPLLLSLRNLSMRGLTNLVQF
jgi:hypothetical protein